jgi:hypothetical protein
LHFASCDDDNYLHQSKYKDLSFAPIKNGRCFGTIKPHFELCRNKMQHQQQPTTMKDPLLALGGNEPECTD